MDFKKKVFDFFDTRLGIRDILEQNLTKYLLPRNINVWYTLGAVLLTHIPPWHDPDEVLTEATPHFDGPVSLAVTGGVWHIG